MAGVAVPIVEPTHHHHPRYDSLPDGKYIRLLQLEPLVSQTDVSSPTLSVTMSTFPLEQAPAFWALSYTWGAARYRNDLQEPDVALKTIQCNGEPAEVGENLFDFLVEARCRRLFRASIAAEDSDSDEPFEYLAKLPHAGPSNHDSHVKGRSAYLWADALCINQEDLEERSHHVHFMGEIYKSAARVLVWLGPKVPSDNVSWVLEELTPQLSRLRDVENYNFFLRRSIDLTDPDLVKYLGEENCARWRRSFVEFWDFFGKCRWFGRGWVVQEVLSSTRGNVAILAGHKTLDFWCMMDICLIITNYFGAAMIVSRWMTKENPESGAFWHNTDCGMHLRSINSIEYLVNKLRRRTKEEQERRKWDEILRLFCKMSVYGFSDDRDHVYGCLGLAKMMLGYRPQDEELIIPDYNLSRKEVFTRIMTLYYRNAKDLDLAFSALETSEQRHRDYRELPSWVPDFTLRNRENFLHSSVYASGSFYARFNALGAEPLEGFLCEIRDTTLLVEGSRLDVVAKGSLGGWSSSRRKPRHAIWILDYVAQEGGYRDTGESYEEAVLRTNVTDIYRSGEFRRERPAPSAEDAREWFALYIANCFDPRKLENKGLEQADLDGLKSKLDALQPKDQLPTYESVQSWWGKPTGVFYERLRQNIWKLSSLVKASGREFVTTESGYLGLAPSLTRRGDEIWIIRGSRIPVVLRKAKWASAYHILGHAYIHGAMHGEAMTEEFKAGFKQVGLV